MFLNISSEYSKEADDVKYNGITSTVMIIHSKYYKDTAFPNSFLAGAPF